MVWYPNYATPASIVDAGSGFAIASGQVEGTTAISKFGQNSYIGTAAYEDIWDGGGTYVWPTTAAITEVYSTGEDAQPIEVQGLDVDGYLVTQTVTLSGVSATSVDLTTPLWRVFRMKNVGTVDIGSGNTVHASGTGQSGSYAQIQNGNNQTLMALYTIPRGKTGYMSALGASMGGVKTNYVIDGHLYHRPYGGVFQLKHTIGTRAGGTSTIHHHYPVPLVLTERTDVKFSAISSLAAGELSISFDITLVDN